MGLDLIDRVPDELWTEVHDIVQETRIKTVPKKKKCKKAKQLSEEALQIAVKRREAKSKGEKERYKHLNAEFQRRARRDKKAFSGINAKKQRKTIVWERLVILSIKLEIPREHFIQIWEHKGQKWQGPNRKQNILRRGGKNTQKNCTKNIFTTQIITMV